MSDVNTGESTLLNKMSAIKVAKAAVRNEVGNKIGILSILEKQKQSQAVVNKLFKLPEFKKSRNVSVFLSTENEVDTVPIVKKIFDDGKKCFVPRYNKRVMEMVKLNSAEELETLPMTKWNIKQPSFKEARENALDEGLDLIIVPGVAFTKDGLRLGHGGGYYDKYLKVIKDIPNAITITVGVAFREQIVDDLPTEETDEIIDIVLYPD